MDEQTDANEVKPPVPNEMGCDARELIRADSQAVLEQLVRLADQLHVALFDAIVDHLDVVTSSLCSMSAVFS